ncbi:MAG: STAS domain-containing protein [Desulfobacterales bacterium]|nr:STAS domain-containing protein [Desulfobacterales bacterium]
MKVTVISQGSDARLDIAGDVDEAGAAILKSKFNELDKSSVKNVIIDFAKVNHIGSAGIGKLLLLYKDLAPLDITLKIVNTSSTVFELFKMVKLDSIFKITRA